MYKPASAKKKPPVVQTSAGLARQRAATQSAHNRAFSRAAANACIKALLRMSDRTCKPTDTCGAANKPEE